MDQRPEEKEYDAFFAGYVSLVPEADVVSALERQTEEVIRAAAGVGPDRETFRYAEGKWSVREVFSHLVDAEQIFGYRAFCISRGDQASLPGFDENDYVAESDARTRSLAGIAGEFSAVRNANLLFLRRLDDRQMMRLGTANGKPISVRALASIMAGHVRHHFAILRSRYGVEGPAQPS